MYQGFATVESKVRISVAPHFLCSPPSLTLCWLRSRSLSLSRKKSFWRDQSSIVVFVVVLDDRDHDSSLSTSKIAADADDRPTAAPALDVGIVQDPRAEVT